MKTTIVHVAMLMVWFLTTIVHAADLSKIDRSIAQQPTYASTPGYCLLVFGAEAETRVWIIEDGETIYVDRNANGDLTEPGEALRPVKRQDFQNYRDATFETVEIVPSSGAAAHSNLTISFYQTDDDPVRHTIKVNVNGRHRQMAGWRTIFSDTPETAQIIHFGGEFAPQPLREKQLSLRRPSQELHLCWVNSGLGEHASSRLGYEAVPQAITPVAEIEWPSRNSQEPIRTRVELVHRC